jgi:tetratricopeptide (TPR) repeat protein
VGVATLFVACSTQKTKWANVHYHNITCHFNVWWNGNQSLEKGIVKLQKEAEDDYTQILPVYQLGTQEQSMKVKSEMDRAIEKGLKGIKKHSIYQKGKEWVAYVKDCYLLTAYGTFYEQDYSATDNTCRLIISQFSGTNEADEAKVLLARSMTRQKQYNDAEALLDQLVRESEAGNIDKHNRGLLYMAEVECCLPQEKYKKSVENIRLALDEVNDRQTKARLYFILAQIYQKLDKRSTASRYYEKVLSYKPTYIMEFNARISMAACSDMNNTDIEALNKSLDKMLKDRKNEEYKDQIYYAKGDMYMGVKDAQKACDNYKLAVQAAKPKSAMKAKAALKMADVLYDVYENYDAAQSYYDTAMHIITVEYPHYDEIRERHYILTSLVEYTRVISRNDSLITVADMDSTTKINYIQQKIEEVKAQEEKEKEEQLLKQMDEERQAANKTLEGDWYFYTSRNVQQGKESFRRDWGNRVLEDYWFLSHKDPTMMSTMMNGMLSAGPGKEEEKTDTSIVSADSNTKDITSQPAKQYSQYGNPDDPHSVAYYLKGLPTTQAQRDSMHTEEATCLLNAGYLYYDGVKNTGRAIESYLRMANDFSDDPQIVQTFYQLYRIYSLQGNTPQANYYRDMVLMGFPDSDYANLIRDDNYYKEIVKRNEKSQVDYANVYRDYRRGRYNDVIAEVDRALLLYKEEPLMGKFKYWKGMALQQNNQRDTARAVFQAIVNNYPDTSKIVELAKAQLGIIEKGGVFAATEENITAEDEQKAKNRYNSDSRPAKMDDSPNEQSAGQDELPAESLVYRYRENMQHYVIVIVNDKKIVATQLQYKIADFNSANYANSGYRSSPLMFTDSTQMITIHRFNNAEEAMLYYKHIQLDGGPLSGYNPNDYTIFAISTQNYTTFYNRKNTKAYAAFFIKYYLSK